MHQARPESFLRRRTLIPLLIALVVLAALGVAFYLRAKAPPEAARLLPESDAIVFVHLKEVRALTHFDEAAEPRSPELQHFIDATGIVPERDIDAAALALHRVPDVIPPAESWPAGKGARRDPQPGHSPRAGHGTAPGPAAQLYASEVFVGRFDGQRLQHFLQTSASARETYAGREIYSIPVDGQTVRVAQLSYDTIGASNMPTAEQLHSMLDRSRASALSNSGSSLLAAYFPHVPLLSQAWGIGHIGLPFSQDGYISVLGLKLPLPEDTDLVATLGYNRALQLRAGGSVHLRIEEFAPDEAAASSTVETLTTVLGLLRGIGNAQPSHDPPGSAVRSLLNSVELEHHRNVALLNASATLDQLRVLATAHNPAAATGVSPVIPSPNIPGPEPRPASLASK